MVETQIRGIVFCKRTVHYGALSLPMSLIVPKMIVILSIFSNPAHRYLMCTQQAVDIFANRVWGCLCINVKNDRGNCLGFVYN